MTETNTIKYKRPKQWLAKILMLICMILTVSETAYPSDLSVPARKKFRIVFLISEDPNNYEAHKTIPEFAELLRREHGFEVNVILGRGERTSFYFPGLEVLSKADLLVVFSRRVALQDQQLETIKAYLGKGKPLIGIRTANHAFTLQGPDVPKAGYATWEGFVSEILGCKNRGYGPTELGTDVIPQQNLIKHPILKGIDPDGWHSTGNLYLVSPLLDSGSVVLLTGRAGDRLEPIAWTRMANKSRVFYTSLGYPDDFQNMQFRKLLINGIRWALNRKKY